LFLPFLSGLASAAAYLTADPAMRIAHAQTIFNLVCSLLALPFAARIASGIQWLIPDRMEPAG
jgi:phosphate:Na+ symporter